MYTGGVRRQSFPLFLFFGFFLSISNPAHAIKTASSFDINYCDTNLSLTTLQVGNTLATPLVRSLSSSTGFEVDYNVALFDYRTVASMSFMQYESSNLGPIPLSRIAFGASYNFIRVNGQRVLLDNGVESKVWGVSPSVEVSLGLTKLSIQDPSNKQFNFSAALLDVLPRLIVEIPVNTTIILMLRGGYQFSFGGSDQFFKIGYTGTTIDLGFRLTTL